MVEAVDAAASAVAEAAVVEAAAMEAAVVEAAAAAAKAVVAVARRLAGRAPEVLAPTEEEEDHQHVQGMITVQSSN